MATDQDEEEIETESEEQTEYETPSKAEAYVHLIAIFGFLGLMLYFLIDGRYMIGFGVFLIAMGMFLFLTDEGQRMLADWQEEFEEGAEHWEEEMKAETQQQQTSSAAKNICGKCGWQNPSVNNFCNDCGTEL